MCLLNGQIIYKHGKSGKQWCTHVQISDNHKYELQSEVANQKSCTMSHSEIEHNRYIYTILVSDIKHEIMSLVSLDAETLCKLNIKQ